jgi:hypothetical protein
MSAATLSGSVRWPRALRGGAGVPLPDPCTLAWKFGKAWAAMPFDALRVQYADAVRCGLLERSMLASRDFERAVGTLERLSMGPLARRV